MVYYGGYIKYNEYSRRNTSFQHFQGVGQNHAFLNCHGILSGPLGDLLVHFLNLGRIHGPETTFPLIRAIRNRLLDLLETLIQAQIVTDGVFPTGGSSFKVRKVFAIQSKVKVHSLTHSFLERKVVIGGQGGYGVDPSVELNFITFYVTIRLL